MAIFSHGRTCSDTPSNHGKSDTHFNLVGEGSGTTFATFPQEIYSNICYTESLETQLVQALNNKSELELETRVINKLLALNKSYEFAQEK